MFVKIPHRHIYLHFSVAIQINNFCRAEDESDKEYFEKKRNVIENLIAKKKDSILLIVDNLDSAEEKNISLLFDF